MSKELDALKRIKGHFDPDKIYRKLKDYIKRDDTGSTVIFGNLMSTDCCFSYEDENGKWQEWFGCGVYGYEMDFLLEYYVVGIHPKYKLEKDTIVPYLHITLYKEEPNL